MPVRALAAAFLIALGLAAQSQDSAPAFEVASVKPSPADARGVTFQFVPGGLRVGNGTLRGIIEMAYDVRDFQISGGPRWLDSDRYDIDAKAAADDPGPHSTNQAERIQATRARLRTLLAQRFQLQVRRDTKELPVLALEVAKNGSKLTEGEAGGANLGIRSGCGFMVGTRATMANLVWALSRNLALPVHDRTELPGSYNFQLHWTPEAGPCPEADENGPDLFTALQRQLGLRLESTRGPVEVVVVVRVEKPEAN